jgi:hypothetical protein
MRSVIYGTLITVFLASAGTVQAANDLDGKALLCKKNKYISNANPYHGFVFDAGKVTRWGVRGYSKVMSYHRPKKYFLDGSNKVTWYDNRQIDRSLDRQTLKVNGLQCKISSKKEIFLELDEGIANAKKKNKL